MRKTIRQSKRIVALCAVLLLLGLRVGPAATPVAGQGAGPQITGVPVKATQSAVVNFAELARQEAARAASQTDTADATPVVVPNLSIEEAGSNDVLTPAKPTIQLNPSAPSVASPSPVQNFLAHNDVPKVGTGSSVIPPDTQGAVGPDKVFVTLNNNYVIEDKATGAVLSAVSMNTFWASTGATGLFDPRSRYDPYNGRWILAGTSNAQDADSSIVVGVSQTTDPSGTWFLFRFDADSSNTLWADFPPLGFNKNWVAISVNMFTINSNSFAEGRLLVIDYPSLRSGVFAATYLTGISAANGGFVINPAVTYSATEPTLYLVSHLSSSLATYKLSTITGTPASPTLTIGATKTNPLGAWTQPSGDILPQLLDAGTRGIDVGDAFTRSNVIFRNGSIYYSQTIGLPAGGSLTHTAAQWVQIDTSGNFVQGGRVEDSTATSTNGGKWYAYSSLSVNFCNDVMLGFSQFASNQYASAGYTFRLATDAANTMRDPFIYKAGLAYYEKTFSGTRNRWGDYSNTQVDPSNDYDLWTIQEWADNRVGTGNGSGRWSTQWAHVSARSCNLSLPLSYFLPLIIR